MALLGLMQADEALNTVYAVRNTRLENNLRNHLRDPITAGVDTGHDVIEVKKRLPLLSLLQDHLHHLLDLR